MRRGTNDERIIVRDQIRAIVEKIWLYPVKLGELRRSPVRAFVEIHFKTGEFVRALELDDGSLGHLTGPKLDKTLRQQCEAGWRFTAKDYAKARKLFESI